MSLGKRPRPPIRRTTSMTGITVDLPSNVEDQDPSYHQGAYMGLLATVSPKTNLRGANSGDFVETSDFLRTCGLCRRRLAPGRDIYMYRGDAAYCSLECREQQMKQDERKEKRSTSGGFVSSSPSNKQERKQQQQHASPSTTNKSDTIYQSCLTHT